MQKFKNRRHKKRCLLPPSSPTRVGIITNKAQQVTVYRNVKHSWKESLTSQISAQVTQQQKIPNNNQRDIKSWTFMGLTFFHLILLEKKLHIGKTVAVLLYNDFSKVCALGSLIKCGGTWQPE